MGILKVDNGVIAKGGHDGKKHKIKHTYWDPEFLFFSSKISGDEMMESKHRLK